MTNHFVRFREVEPKGDNFSAGRIPIFDNSLLLSSPGLFIGEVTLIELVVEGLETDSEFLGCGRFVA